MKIDYKTSGEGLMIFLSGELDHHAAGAVMSETADIIDRNLPGALIIDLAGVGFMDSSGIAVILSARRKMDMINGGVILRGVQPQPLRVLNCAGIGRLVKII